MTPDPDDSNTPAHWIAGIVATGVLIGLCAAHLWSGVPILALGALIWLCWECYRYRDKPGGALKFAGALCILLVVVTLVLQVFRLFPAVDWDDQQSIAHYLRLAVSLAGLVPLVDGTIRGSPESKERWRDPDSDSDDDA